MKFIHVQIDAYPEISVIHQTGACLKPITPNPLPPKLLSLPPNCNRIARPKDEHFKSECFGSAQHKSWIVAMNI
jgi:hypothetical protein